MPTLDVDTVSRLWVLDLDSLHRTGDASAHFEHGSNQQSISPGSDVDVYYCNTTADTSVAADSAHFTIRYDQNSLSLKSWSGMNGWNVVKADPQSGSFEVWLHGSGTLSTLPMLSTTFSTILADTVAKVYLEEPLIYSHRKNCDCAVTSNTGNDSVEIDFTGCGGPTLWHFMQTGSIFELLNVQPNPASNELRVGVRMPESGEPIRLNIYDLLGDERMTHDVTSPSTTLDVSALPTGTYFLRLSSQGEVRTHRFVIDR